MFRRVTGPHGSVLQFVAVEAGVNDFFELVLSGSLSISIGGGGVWICEGNLLSS